MECDKCISKAEFFSSEGEKLCSECWRKKRNYDETIAPTMKIELFY